MNESTTDPVASQVSLREVAESDLDLFFVQQLDADANWLAAFTAPDPSDRHAFDAHWRKIRASDTVFNRTILYDGAIAGSVLSYEEEGRTEVSYWLGREFWGKGIATAALAHFLKLRTQRPLHARAAKDNLGSIRVLEKCGFTICGEDSGFANARGAEIDEGVYWLHE